MAAVLGVWRIASDLNWAGGFAIHSGLFSHWQVWLGGAALVQACSYACILKIALNGFGVVDLRAIDKSVTAPRHTS